MCLQVWWNKVSENHESREAAIAKLMETQIWGPPASFVWEGFRKGTVASVKALQESYPSGSFPNARQFSIFSYVPGAFQAALSALELSGSESE